MAENRDIKYINRSFSDFKQTLIDYAKSYFPQAYNDFTEASPGTMFIEMASYIGDVLSFYQDTQIQENLLIYAKEKENLMALAYSLGYRPKVTAAAQVMVDIYQLIPKKTLSGVSAPNFDYALIVNNNTILTSTSTGQTFLTQDLVNFGFSSSFDPTEITVYNPDNTGAFSYYLFKKSVKAISGNIKTTTATFNSPERFPNLTVTDDNIIHILDVTDSDGNTWYEVPYLAQDTIFEENQNIGGADPNMQDYNDTTPYLLKLKKVPRRFVSRFRADNILELQFGAGVVSAPDEEIIPNPDNVGIGLVDGISKLNLAYDPSNFIFTKSYGLAPANTTLTIRYIVGGGIESNVPSNDITTIDKTNILYNVSLVSASPSINLMLDSVACNNAVAAVGGKGGDTNDELRLNTLATFPTQLRAVTREDYIIRALSMPPKYGSVSKVYVVQDSKLSPNSGNDNLIDNNPLSLSMYVLSYNGSKNLTSTSLGIKNNLKTYISQYRLVTDAINLKNAYIINIGVNFDVIVLPGYNNRSVILDCITALKTHFNIDRWQINQPIVLSELYNIIGAIKGVQSVPKVEVVNKAGGNYSPYGYDVAGATKNGIVYPSLDPSVFEVKYLDQDIIGRTVTN